MENIGAENCFLGVDERKDCKENGKLRVCAGWRVAMGLVTYTFLSHGERLCTSVG